MQTKAILDFLIFSCINYEPQSFIPYLLSDQVKTNMPNKVRFYKFFNHMLACTAKNSEGELRLRIKRVYFSKEKGTQDYSFYDTKHEHARLNMEVEERDNKMYIATLAF
jgi:hypothetical protein